MANAKLSQGMRAVPIQTVSILRGVRKPVYGVVRSVGRVFATVQWENGCVQRVHRDLWSTWTVLDRLPEFVTMQEASHA